MQLEEIKGLISASKYEISFHADRERRNENLEIVDLKNAMAQGEILEDYPTDPRGPSCLILGFSKDGRPIHIICGKLPTNIVRLITVYIPSLPKWLDPRTRKVR
jgi:hypothetical protein